MAERSNSGSPPNISTNARPNDTVLGHESEKSKTNHNPSQVLPNGLDQDIATGAEAPFTDGSTRGHLDKINNLYRLLDLYQENSSGGLVEKVLIDQKSLRRLLNTLLPNSYISVSKIDFKALDKLTIKPLGIYGLKSEIIKFLRGIKCLNDESDELLTSSIGTPNDLRSGLYLALPLERDPNEVTTYQAYIVYWPEDSTWDDAAISSIRRNRVTFMRYLSKLTDQMIALVSPEQAKAMVWTAATRNADIPGQTGTFEESRMFSFEVAATKEQEESATASPGFTLPIDARVVLPKEVLQLQLVPGEERAGLLVSTHKPAYFSQKNFRESFYPTGLQALLNSKTSLVTLGDLSGEQLEILGEHGLRERYPQHFAQFDQRIRDAVKIRDDKRSAGTDAIKEDLRCEKPQLKYLVHTMIWKHFTHVYPYASKFIKLRELGSSEELALRAKYPGLIGLSERIEKTSNIQIIDDEEFQNLKLAWHTIRDFLLSDPNRSSRRQDEFINEVLGKHKKRSYAFSLQKAKELWVRFIGSESGEQQPTKPASDPEFVESLHPLELEYPVISKLTGRVVECLQAYLNRSAHKIMQKYFSGLVNESRTRRTDCVAAECQDGFEKESVAIALVLRDELKSSMPSSTSNFTRIDNIFLQPGHYGMSPKIHVSAVKVVEYKAQAQFTIHPLELTEYDIQRCRSDEFYVPEPKLGTGQYFRFALEESHSIEFLQLIRDKCFVVIAESEAYALYISDNIELPGAISTGRAKLRIKYERLGGKCIFAVDQGTRLLAIFHRHRGPRISMYGFDESFLDIRARGPELSLEGWYDGEPQIESMCFVSGTEEICLVESSGRARILSLVTLNFRPAFVEIRGKIVDVCSTPDGSCLLASVAMQNSSSEHKLLAFHWASFGSNQDGIDLATLPISHVGRITTSFEGRSKIHLLSLDREAKTTTSVVLQIKQKSAEFSFRSNQSESASTTAQTVNNSLIDCHMEVWTRFPVLPAVSRSTLSSTGREDRKLVFSSASGLELLNKYFEQMISTFVQTTHKPIGNALSSIFVAASFSCPDVLVQTIPCSRYQLGSFIVEFMCLIPIHLAITRNNRFIPLKDGVWNSDHERSLLGAGVTAIIDALSIGWYESLFQSYMSNKPVRVVSSMGEQSVGKSYCLNHFADTSFAGSAMRTTEGVWLSCTPTEDYLLVSLDFEGVHSIERTAQEDALLVLFNSAISNLVLFRNNFALSRDIAGLFSSFQSSAMVLDPDANPGLFNSVLAIIIKDVTDADSREIVKEFVHTFNHLQWKSDAYTKVFAQISDDCAEGTRTKFHIKTSSWKNPDNAMASDQFPRAGVFLHNMKTLMAKIKESRQMIGGHLINLATHRALQINERLQDALSRGADFEGPLKVNLDTDEEVASLRHEVEFFVPNLGGLTLADDTIMEHLLKSLTDSCTHRLGIAVDTARDVAFIDRLQQQLLRDLDLRMKHVRHWIQVNVQRFPPENQDIRNIHGKIDSLEIAMRAALQLCSEKCSTCHYLCVRPRRHVGEHQCGTTHRCPFLCEVSGQHSNPVDCGLPAGHSARHMCTVNKHSCGSNCHLIGKDGRLTMMASIYVQRNSTCVESHAASGMQTLATRAQVAALGRGMSSTHVTHAAMFPRAPLSVSCVDDYVAYQTISTDWKQMRCISVDKGTPAQTSVETQPYAVEEKFSGRHEVFQYTRYTQVEQRLTCVIPIPPGALKHTGEHRHSTDPNAFHFCDVRCPNCRYLCNLPIGYTQNLHETSHGSMVSTQWTIEGADFDSIYELNGRKFGVGDEGAPMLCHLVCAEQGRHAHIDFCRDSEDCGGHEWEHIGERMHPEIDRPKDWISHRLKWARSGFKDPYSREQQLEFAKCTAFCSDPEHERTSNLSQCNLPIFHAPLDQHLSFNNSYVSADGHRFECTNPARLQEAYHIIFVIDSSTSMRNTDRTPLRDTPVSALLRDSCNNRYGAVLSALYGFLRSREAIYTTSQPRQDAYTVVTFSKSPQTRVCNDFTSTTDQLIRQLAANSTSWGTNFNAALSHAQTLIQSNWSNDKMPALVFLSDGECDIDHDTVYELCRTCVRLGKPLAFFSVSFGSDRHSDSLRQMAKIAQEVYSSAPRDARNATRENPCSYHNAIDSIQLATTFLAISNSLQKPRASLIGTSLGGRPLQMCISPNLRIKMKRLYIMRGGGMAFATLRFAWRGIQFIKRPSTRRTPPTCTTYIGHANQQRLHQVWTTKQQNTTPNANNDIAHKIAGTGDV
ncbi:hypothetical protein CTheo_8242 [Ceratobasidium theobromae]|uniref:VWFA domain-containing protein n=1 Tax=Ceratobasidium theobromae TaxID=1582974 RepID=A0A5N5QA85_9AGAM|nr:hypothetical protein CTheo_8242 [Ceratobasidium theobromae]